MNKRLPDLQEYGGRLSAITDQMFVSNTKPSRVRSEAIE